MTQGIHDFQSKSYGTYLPNSPAGYDKAYGQDGSYIKNLGGANPELTNYYENQLLPYWQAVQSGEIQISQQDYAQLQQYMQYCQYELGLASSAWGNGGFDSGMGGIEGQGPVQNGTYTDAENELTVDGSVATSDVWGNATLNVPPPCTATFETTTDNRFNPPETVVKAIITNPAMKGPDGGPAVSAVYIHDGGKITCNGSKKGDGTSRISDSTGTVTIGEYQAKAEDAKPEASIAGVKDEATGEINYESESWEDWIEFYPQPGENQVHNFYGNANINAKASDKIDIVCNEDGTVIVTVTHLDQSTDIFKGQDGCSLNVNGNPVNITADGGELAEGIPAEFLSRIQINGKEVKEATQSTEIPQEWITKYGEEGAQQLADFADSIDMSYEDFNRIAKIDRYSGILDEIGYGIGKTPSQHLLNFLFNYDDRLLATKAAGNWGSMTNRLAEILSGIGFEVEAQTSLEDAKNDDGKTTDNIKIGDTVYDLKMIDVPVGDNSYKSFELVAIKGKTAEEKSADETKEKANKIKTSDIVGNVPSQGGATWNVDEALDLAELIGSAIQNGNWQDVKDYFETNKGWNGGNKNNIIRKVVAALYKAAGSNNDVFLALMDKMPDDVLKTMKNWVESEPDGTNEASEKGDGDQWNSAGTAAKIQEAIDLNLW